MTTNAFPDWMLYEYMFRHPEMLQSSLISEYNEHKAIVDALATKDAEIASYHVAYHIKNLWQGLQAYLNISGDFVLEVDQQIESLFPNHKI